MAMRWGTFSASVVICATILLSVPISGAAPSTSAAPAQAAPNVMIRRLVTSELKAESEDHSHWMFQLETKQKDGTQKVVEVVETRGGDLQVPLRIRGAALNKQERQKAEGQLRQWQQDPGQLKKSLKDKDQDADRSRRLLRMLPDAFIFSYGARDGDRLELTFRPNPAFHPSSREATVFHAMKGSVWVDEKQNRLAAITGRLISDVKFGWGVLGHLNKGGTFEVRQEEVAPGFWELTVLNVHMNGKALFFKTIAVQQNELHREFKRVADDLTVAQAVAMLRKVLASQEPGPG